MPFNQLTKEDNSYSINSRRNFNSLFTLNEFVEQTFEFAYGMTFGHVGEHRNHRTGGVIHRKNGELFINAFQGKLAEFGLWKYLGQKGINGPEPEVGMWEAGTWDDTDLIYNGKKLNIKSAAFFSNLLLLEYGDWSPEGYYIPNTQTAETAYQYFILTRIKPDGKKLMRDNKLYLSNTVNKEVLREIIATANWEFDIAGFISRAQLVTIIANELILPQGGLLNGQIPMDATNYYCQSGDMNPIASIIPLLR